MRAASGSSRRTSGSSRDRQGRPQLARLEDDADPLAERALAALGSKPSTLDLAGVSLPVALEDLDRRRLAGAVRAEQAEHLARRDLEVDAAHGLDPVVGLPQAADGDRASRNVDLDDARRREVALACAERSRDLGAVRLVADRDDRACSPSIAASTASASAPGASRSSTRSSALRRLRDRARRLPRAQERARRRRASGSVVGEPLAQLARLLAAAGAQRPQLVGFAGIGVGVADEEEAHGSVRIDSWRCARSATSSPTSSPTAPLAGNQLAVFTDARDLDEVTMQALALELGLSETVYVLPPREGGTVRVRIFTPRNEIPFAGHPCLGTAFVLGAPLQLVTIALETGSGLVPVRARARRVRPDRLRPDDAAGADGRAVRARRRDARRARRRAVRAAGRGLRQRRPARVRRPAREGGRRAAEARPERARRARPRRRARVRRLGDELEGAHVLAARRRRRGRGDRIGGGTARLPPRAATASSRGARRSRSSRARRSAGPRRSTRVRPAPADAIESVEVGGSAVTVARGEFRVP